MALKEGRKRFSVWFSNEVQSLLEAESAARHASVSSIVQEIVSKFIDENPTYFSDQRPKLTKVTEFRFDPDTDIPDRYREAFDALNERGQK